MGKIIVEVETSIDSVMGQSADFWNLVFKFHTPDVEEYLNNLLSMPDALLMGQETYTSFAQVWPTRPGAQADRINRMPKYVASRTLKAPLEWNARLISGNVAEEIRRLKQAPGKDLLQYGVGALTHLMLEQGLVDELIILVFPFTFGEGPRIFDHMGIHTLNLLGITTFISGAVAHRYQVADR